MPKIDKKSFVFLWLFNPFLSACYLFKDFRQNTNIGPYLLLSLFFGISFVVSTTSADSQRYADQLILFHRENISLSTILSNFYGEEGGTLDIYQPVITWLVSVFTDNVKVLFAVFALVFGYFWFKSLILVRGHITAPLAGLTLVTFILFALTKPIWAINGVRMWTAVGIFFYGILLLNLQKNKKGWFFLILPLFVHFSLIVGLVLYVAFQLITLKNKTLFFGIFIVTFFFGELNLEIIRNYFELLPGFAQSKKGYLNEEYVENFVNSSDQFAAHVLLANLLSKYSIVIMSALIYFYSVNKKKIMTRELEVFYTMGLFFASFSNLAASVPSGGRFLALSNLILITAFLLFLNQRIKMPTTIVKLLQVSILFIIVFKIREGLDFIGIFLFIGNPIINWFVVDTPLIDQIKGLF